MKFKFYDSYHGLISIKSFPASLSTMSDTTLTIHSFDNKDSSTSHSLPLLLSSLHFLFSQFFGFSCDRNSLLFQHSVNLYSPVELFFFVLELQMPVFVISSLWIDSPHISYQFYLRLSS